MDLGRTLWALVRRHATAFCPLREKRRIIQQILWRTSRTVTLKTRNALLDVGSVADLAHLTVADDVDTNFNLSGHRIFDRTCNGHVEFSLVVFLLPLLRENQLSNFFRSRQTANMRCQYPLSAVFH